MKYIIAIGLLFLSMFTSAQTIKRGLGGDEAMRIEKLDNGYLVALRSLPIATGTQYIDMTIKLGSFDATDGAHIAIGLGDLYRYYDTGTLPPVADGYVLGKSNGCPEKGVAFNFESYGGEIPGKTLDCPTAFGPLKPDTIYQIRLDVTSAGVSRIVVALADDTVVWQATRTFDGMHGPHARGLFVIPINPIGKKNGTYELIKMSAGTNLFSE